MVKHLIILLACVSTNIIGQTFPSGLRLTIKEKVKSASGKQLAINQTITVTLNGSTNYTLTTDTEGNLNIKNLTKGKYNIKVEKSECRAQEWTDIVLGEGKTAYVEFLLICDSYINSLTKKEKRKLGYK